MQGDVKAWLFPLGLRRHFVFPSRWARESSVAEYQIYPVWRSSPGPVKLSGVEVGLH